MAFKKVGVVKVKEKEKEKRGIVLGREFHIGDLVLIKSDPVFKHAGARAVVREYRNFAGDTRNAIHSYALGLENGCRAAWYSQDNLGLIAHNKLDLFKGWQKKRQALDKQRCTLDWIFKNGELILEDVEIANQICRPLAECLGVQLWGRWKSVDRTGVSYRVENIIELAAPYLRRGDRKGFGDFAKGYVAAVEGVRLGSLEVKTNILEPFFGITQEKEKRTQIKKCGRCGGRKIKFLDAEDDYCIKCGKLFHIEK